MTTTTPSVLMPAGAIKVYDWDDTESPHPIRVFDGTTRFIECNGRYEKEDVMVRLQGIQHAVVGLSVRSRSVRYTRTTRLPSSRPANSPARSSPQPTRSTR